MLYIFLMSLTHLLGTLSMWMYIPRMVFRPCLREFRLWMHLRETLVYFVPTVAASLYTVLNKVLIGAVGGDPRENGYYEQADKIIGMAKMLAFVSLNSVMGARMSWLFGQGADEEIRRRILRSMDYVLFSGIGIVFGLVGVAPRFVPWFFGPGYDKAAGLIVLLSPIVLIIGISNAGVSLLQSGRVACPKRAFSYLWGGYEFVCQLFSYNRMAELWSGGRLLIGRESGHLAVSEEL